MKHHRYIIIGFFLVLGCASSTPKKIAFENPVDTTTKPITEKESKLYHNKQLGVYATNDFPGGKLDGFTYYNDSTSTANIVPENTPINDSPYYSFKLWSNQPIETYIKLTYPKKNKHRYFPKIKTGNQPWQPLDSNNVIVIGKDIFLKTSITKDSIWISAQEVISSQDTYAWAKKIVEKHSAVSHYYSIGKTPLGRDLPVIDMYSGDTKNKPIIVLLTRQHPPEVTGFMAFKTFIETILSETTFLDQYRVLAFPIMNPDGVDLGHWRHNSGGVDLNRDWATYQQTEIKQVVTYINKTVKKNNSEIHIGLDFHSTWNDVFYTNIEEYKTRLPNFKNQWLASLEKEIPEYKVNEKPSISKKPVSKAWFLKAHHATGITYEIGDETDRQRIKEIASTSAIQLIKILEQNKTP